MYVLELGSLATLVAFSSSSSSFFKRCSCAEGIIVSLSLPFHTKVLSLRFKFSPTFFLGGRGDSFARASSVSMTKKTKAAQKHTNDDDDDVDDEREERRE